MSLVLNGRIATKRTYTEKQSVKRIMKDWREIYDLDNKNHEIIFNPVVAGDHITIEQHAAFINQKYNETIGQAKGLVQEF